MTLLVVGYPQLSHDDYAFIQAIRQRHDPHFALIDPHFTIVFPTETSASDEFIQHIDHYSQAIGAFSFTVRCATIVRDTFSPYTHLFLVPDEGNSAVVKAHDALYTGMLAPQLRLDIPYIPHITIGAMVEPASCKQVADQLNAQPLAISGRVDHLDVISHSTEEKRVVTLKQIALR